MKTPHGRAALFVSGAIIGLTATSPAFAQAKDPAAVQEIVVTARRIQERLQDVPISISVYNQQQLDHRNIVMGSDLAVYTPSLTVNQRYGAEVSSFAIRGFLQESNTAPSVGVYFAEAATPRSFGGTLFGSNLPIGSFMDLENTQILKGPQGTLFGRNTTGGAILLEPKRPTDRHEGYVEVSAGDYGMWRGQAVLNLPLADTLKVRIGIDRMKRDGYMRNRSGIGPADFDNTDYTYARFSILADLTPTLQNYTIAHFSDSHTNGFAPRIVACARTLQERLPLGAGIFTAPSACAQIDRATARGDGPLDVDVPLTNPYSKIREWQAINHTTWQANSDLTVKNIVSYSQYTADENFNLGGENFTTMDTGLGLPVPVVKGLPFATTVLSAAPNFHSANQWTITEELQLQGKAMDGRLNWQAGGYLEVSKSPDWSAAWTNIFLTCLNQQIQALQCFNPFGFGSISAFKSKSDYNNHALYAQATYRATDRLSITGGVRYTWDKLIGTSESTRFQFPLTGGGPIQVCNDSLRFHNPNGTPLVVTDTAQCHMDFPVKSSKPTWVIDADYKPTEDMMVYAKYARGYRAGGVALGNIGLETWQPEKLNTYEIGLKATFRGPVRGYFNAAGFYNDFTNQQLITTTRDKVTHVAQGNAIVNIGSSTIKGVEIDTAVTLFENLDLSLGYTFLDTKIKTLTVPTSPILDLAPLAQEGDPLPQVPKNRITTTATYHLPIDETVGRVSLGMTFTHTDKQFFNRNSLPAYLYLPASDLLNFNADWNNVMGRPVDLSFFMTNATNDKVEVVHGGEYNSLGYESVQYGQPRMWGFRMRYRFGE
jgi:iron complex outermembrane receptor protein